MRRFLSLSLMFWLLIVIGAVSSTTFAEPVAPPQPAALHRVQVQCVAIRADISDVDSLGLNFSRVSSAMTFQSVALSRTFAFVANSTDSAQMLKWLTKVSDGSHYAAFIAPVVTMIDGQSGIVSLDFLHKSIFAPDFGIVSDGQERTLVPLCKMSII